MLASNDDIQEHKVFTKLKEMREISSQKIDVIKILTSGDEQSRTLLNALCAVVDDNEMFLELVLDLLKNISRVKQSLVPAAAWRSLSTTDKVLIVANTTTRFFTLNEKYLSGVTRVIPIAASTVILGASTLIGGILTVEALWNIHKWYTGQISGKICLRNCARAAVTTTGGLWGATSGAAIGTAVGSVVPVAGTVVGGMVGAIAGSVAGGVFAHSLVNYLGDLFFNLPPELALKSAYAFLHLSPSCTNDEINNRYDQLLAIDGPNNGTHPDFRWTLETAIALIKEAKGQGVSMKKKN